MILGIYLLTTLGLDIKFSRNIILGGDGPFKGCSSHVVDVSTYDFKYLIDNKVKIEESFINVYIDKCLESEGTIIPTSRIRRILDVKYKKADLNKFIDNQCQQLSSNKR